MSLPRRCCAAILGGLLTAVLLPAGGASADPPICYVTDQIFPTATAPAPAYFQPANGDVGYIARLTNSFPCLTNRQNAWTIHMLVNMAGGEYFESGFYETGTLTIDDWHFFWETAVGGVVVMTNFDSSCGGVKSGDGGHSGFRLSRYWGTTWQTEVDCYNNGTWINTHFVNFPSNPSWGFVRSEAERFTAANGHAGRFDVLKYRDINTAAWNNWTGMACLSTPLNWNYLDLHRLTANAWNLVSGSGGC